MPVSFATLTGGRLGVWLGEWLAGSTVNIYLSQTELSLTKGNSWGPCTNVCNVRQYKCQQVLPGYVQGVYQISKVVDKIENKYVYSFSKVWIKILVIHCRQPSEVFIKPKTLHAKTIVSMWLPLASNLFRSEAMWNYGQYIFCTCFFFFTFQLCVWVPKYGTYFL